MGCGSQWTLKNLRVLPRLSLRSQFRSPLRFNPRSILSSDHSWQLLNKYYTNDLIQMPKVKPGCPLTVRSQQYTKLNYTKQLVFSRRTRTREQSNARSGASMKTENETGEGLFLSPSRFWENWQTDKRTEFAQPTCDFCSQRLEKLVLALQTKAGHLGFHRCSTIIPALWGHNLVKFSP